MLTSNLVENWLAVWTKMSATLPHDNACNRCATFRAGFSCTLVHAEIILEIPTPIDPIDTGTVALDPVP